MPSATQRTLQVSVTFPQGSYSGAEHGSPEEMPSPARLHDAFVAAAAGGPWAQVDGRVLSARDDHRLALQWLEEHGPLGILTPNVRLTVARARRYRWRASPVMLADTDFEPRAALDGPVVYVWPPPPDSVVESLRVLAAEVTHVGRADSVAIVDVTCTQDVGRLMHRLMKGRGPGRVMRVPGRGRTDALARAHAEASRPGGHTPGSTGKQAPDELITGANEVATTPCRFAAEQPAWPFAEVWRLPILIGNGVDARNLLAPAARVATAVGVHRAIVRAMDTDVPPFVTGRDGDGPLRGAGHLSIQLVNDEQRGGPAVLLGIPADVPDADREQLLDALRRPLRAARSLGRKPIWFTVQRPTIEPAVPFWPDSTSVMATATPLVLDAPGRPRQQPWTLEDAVLCSVGYAMRGVLESNEIEWAGGWAFRTKLVEHLRSDCQVRVIARRASVSASRYVHRMPDQELAVAVDAAVNLGRLAPVAGGFLALGRARHLGGGLLIPVARS
ncbi:MAG: type I-U CRISPR-associated protein Csb2 [Solirubrobacteraceae bacterium]